MRTNDAGRDIIKAAESLRLAAYICPAGVPTIGWGHTGDVKLGDRITEHQAEAILDVDLDRSEQAVSRLVSVPLTSNQFSALVSLVFNIGVGAFEGSTLRRLLNTGDYAGASRQFARWRFAAGKELPGLVKRRAAERALFNQPEPTK